MNFKPITDAVYDHFGIWSKLDVFQLPTPNDYDDEFILFNREIEIVTKEVAMSNITDFYGKEQMLLRSDNENIDYYRRLGNTNYFFRWM